MMRFTLLTLLCLALLFSAGEASAGSPEAPAEQAGADFSLPAEYGEIIYRYNPQSTKQLYIIGLSHRSAVTRLNGANTARAQAETYKIGEWLILNKGVELLFPEGFFRAADDTLDTAVGAPAAVAEESDDIEAIEALLRDDSVYVTAEMLLRERYPLRLRQAEDRELYDRVSEGFSSLENSVRGSFDYLALRSYLDYLQQHRTAVMLQKIPGAIDAEFGQGRIGRPAALFTIGLNHIHEIITFIKDNRIALYCPLFAPRQHPDYIADVNLCTGDFGVTVILPRVLADSREALTMTRLHLLLPLKQSPSSDSRSPKPL